MNHKSEDNLEEASASIICIGCTLPIPEESSFCPLCGAPVGATATTDPIKRIFAQGYTNRRFTNGTPRKWTFWATLIIGIIMLTSYIVSFKNTDSLLLMTHSIAWSIFCAIFGFRMYKNYQKHYSQKPPPDQP